MIDSAAVRQPAAREGARRIRDVDALEANARRFLRFVGFEDNHEWIELQAVEVPTGRGSFTEQRGAHARTVDDAVKLMRAADAWAPCAQGLYLIANKLHDAASTRIATRGRWATLGKGLSTTDADVTHRRVLFVDLDTVRPKKTSATNEEIAHADTVAHAIVERLSRVIDRRAIGVGHSGNGRSVLVALDPIAVSTELDELIKSIVVALDLRFSTEHVEIDRTVTEAKRLLPAFGTMKHKGAPGIAERPHRRTAFECADDVERIGVGGLRAVLADLTDGFTSEQLAEIDRALGRKVSKASTSTPTPTGDDPWSRAKAAPIADVLEWLGLIEDGAPKCPGCASVDSGVAIVGNGLKCSHNRCASKGYRDGFRTTIDVVAEVRGVDAKGAVNLLGERFNFDGVRPRADRSAPANDPIDPLGDAWRHEPDARPNRDYSPIVATGGAIDPLEALRRAGAVTSYAALVAATETRPSSIWFPGIEADSQIEISGPSGEGKTTLGMLVVCARANPTARPVVLLGAPVTPAPAGTFVVVVEEENGKFSTRHKLESSCEALGLPVAETIDRMILLVRAGVLQGDPTWQAIVELGKQKKIGLVFVDSRARVLRGGDSNSEDDQAAISNALHKLVTDSGAPVVVISHTRKGERGTSPDSIGDLSGSVQRGAGADVALIVTAKRDAKGAVAASVIKFIKLREAIDEHPAPISYRLAKDAGGRWTIDTDAASAAVVVDDRPAIERVFEIIAQAGEQGATKGEIRKATKAAGKEIGHHPLEEAISLLFADHRLESRKGLAAGKPVTRFLARGEP
ncbi:MAG: AAA family ATPase [Polyangiales bacterium]